MLMESLLSRYINDANHENILEKLRTEGINSKDYPEQNLTILYNKYETPNKSALQMECRSVVIERETNKIVCYSCPTPLYNINAINYLYNNQSSPKETFVCYEGSLMSIFNNKDVWYLASRKCIYNPNMGEESGQFKMFMDTIRQDGYDFDTFTSLLEINTSYHFVLIHHLNENVVDYTKLFGDNYMKLCFIFARNTTTHLELNLEQNTNILSSNIFLPTPVLDYNMESERLKDVLVEHLEHCSSEGVIIKVNNKILKIQNSSYIFNKIIGIDKNMYKGFIKLYQTNSLKAYFDTNVNSEKYKKIVNPTRPTLSYDTVGMIDALFKVCASELHSLFNILYNMDGKQYNNPSCFNLYNVLPEEYKSILYYLRGIFFKNMKKHKIELLSLRDVYNFLKSYEMLEKFIRVRKLMLNRINLQSNDDMRLFTESLYKSDKVYYKMATIYTLKMFPDILPCDIA